MNATDLSSLARFSNADLVNTLQRRRNFRRQMLAQFGRETPQHDAAIQSIFAVVSTMKARGLEIPPYAA